MRSLVLALVVVLTACGPVAGAPGLRFAADVPDDLRALAAETYRNVLDRFPDHHDCLADVTLVGAWELDDRASYDSSRREITLRIPATAGQLRVSLVHELAHHVEFACPSHTAVRGPFLEAQGLDGGTSWFDGPTWEETPSEQWATAVVRHVLDRGDSQARVFVEPAALDVVRAWSGAP